MRASYTYGAVFTATVAAGDGETYAAHVERNAYTGPVTALPLRGLRISWGSEGGAVSAGDPLAPLAPSKAVLTLSDAGGVLAETVGSPDGAWRLRVERTSSPSGLVWLGYLMQEAYEDSPYAATSDTSLTFSDGLGLLAARPVAGDGAEVGTLATNLPTSEGDEEGRRLLSILARHLGDLSADQAMPLVTAVDWRPWQPGGEVTASVDPLRAVYARERAWLDDDGGSASALDAVREIARRFNARVYQSGGKWHVTQRGLLARSGGEDVPRFEYAAGADAAVTMVPADVVLDTREWAQAGPHGAPRRGVTLPVRSVESPYDFAPDLDNAVANPSFETAGATADEAYGWVFEDADGIALADPTTRTELTNSPVPTLVGTNLDAWALRLGAADGAGDARARQEGFVYIPASSDWDVRIGFDVAVLEGGAEDGAGQPQAWGVVAVHGPDSTTWGPVLRTLRAASWSRASNEATVVIQNAFQNDGGLALPAGVRYVPEGAVLRWMRDNGTDPELVGTMRLTAPILADDAKVRGDLTIPGTTGTGFSGETTYLKAGDYAQVYVWQSGAAAARMGINGGGWEIEDTGGGILSRAGRFVADMTGVDEDGEQVAGLFRIQFNNEVAFIPYIDDVEVRFSIGGETAATWSARAGLPSGAAGLDVVLPPSALGDGPLDTSHGALFAEADGEDPEPTLQGEDTGWTEWAYITSGASTGVGIDALAARDALAQLAGPTTGDTADNGGGLERVRTAYLLRDGDALTPEDVVRHWPLTALATTATAGTETVHTRAAPRVGGSIVIGGTTYGVSSVTRGAGLYAVGIDAPLAASQPVGARVAYDLLAWWDGFEWDVPTGAAYVDGSALDLADPDTFTEELTLGTT